VTPEPCPRSSSLALAVLLLLAVLSPWPFGSVQPWATRTIAATGLLTGLVALALQAGEGRFVLPKAPLWLAASVLGLGVFQLIPLPPLLHRVAPASFAAWHPSNPAAAEVLGAWPRPVSVFPAATIDWLASTGAVLLLAVLAAPALSGSRRASSACAIVSGAGAALAVFGIIGHGLLGARAYGLVAVPTIAPYGPFVSKNHFAGYVEVAAMVAAGLAIGLADEHRRGGGSLGWTRSRSAWRVMLAGSASLCMALAVLASLSRGGIISLAGGATALVLLRWSVGRRRRRPRAALVAAVALVTAALVAMVTPLETRERMNSLAGAAGEHSGAFRLDTWSAALRATLASPVVGHGLGTFADAVPRYKTAWGELRAEHAENEYLELLVEAGVAGLVLAAVAIALVLRAVVRALRAGTDRLHRGLGIGALAALAAALLHAGVDFNLHVPSNAVLLGFVASLALSTTGTLISVRRKAGLAAVAAVTLLSAFWLSGRLRPAPIRYDLSDRASAASGPAPARLYLEKASIALARDIARRPLDPERWLLLAWIRLAEGDPQRSEALSQYAVGLDPLWPALRSEALRLGTAPGAR
jgi:O-Antigen ligase